MSDTTNISWCDSTWNPWIGCTKVSEGCVNCYAEHSTPARVFDVKWGDDQPRRISSDETFCAPLKWRKKPWVCDDCGACFGRVQGDTGPNILCSCGGRVHRLRVFLGSLMDWLDPKIPIEVFAGVLDIIRRCPELDFLCVTKRPELFADRLQKALWNMVAGEPSRWICDWQDGKPPSNVWVIATAENQDMADKRIPELEKIPAVVRGLSCEPLLSLIRFRTPADLTRINWVIFGGESGNNARPCNVDWIRDGVRQCKAAGAAAYVKQVGSDSVGWQHESLGDCDACDQPHHPHKGTKYHGWDCYRRLIKHPSGADPSEWPEDLRVQQFPKP